MGTSKALLPLVRDDAAACRPLLSTVVSLIVVVGAAEQSFPTCRRVKVVPATEQEHDRWRGVPD
jgi:hypothetical protein